MHPLLVSQYAKPISTSNMAHQVASLLDYTKESRTNVVYHLAVEINNEVLRHLISFSVALHKIQLEVGHQLIWFSLASQWATSWVSWAFQLGDDVGQGTEYLDCLAYVD